MHASAPARCAPLDAYHKWHAMATMWLRVMSHGSGNSRLYAHFGATLATNTLYAFVDDSRRLRGASGS